MDKNLDSRQRLIRTMHIALATKGLHGIGLNELLEKAQAPKGVMYHHFPGGKTELAVAAIKHSTQITLQQLELAHQKAVDPAQTMSAWFEESMKHLRKNGFEYGCPLAAVALETTPDDQVLREAIAESFKSIRHFLSKYLLNAGISNPTGVAALIVSAYEGSLMQSRVAQSAKPMDEALAALLPMLKIPKK